MECLFAEEVSLVEVPDELLLLGAVLLLRDLDLQERISNSEMRTNLPISHLQRRRLPIIETNEGEGRNSN